MTPPQATPSTAPQATPSTAPQASPSAVPTIGPHEPLRIGNASGFYGDRFDAVREMLEGGPLDVLTGDYLAELTMGILARDRLRDPETGYAKTFVEVEPGARGGA